jgi:endonuclease/exonuclease/phosphatase family metal-dependent hydrolase
MKKLIIISLLLSLLLFASCSPTEVPEIPETESTTAAETTLEETIPAEPGITIAGNDISNYTIVHDGTKAAAEFASDLRLLIYKTVGCRLETKKKTAAIGDYEILIGKTNRAESAEVRSDYSRPNVYYDVKVVGSKLVIMAEGRTTLKKLAPELNALIEGGATSAVELADTPISGNIIAEVDKGANSVSMAERADGTGLRVFHWNFAAPYLDPKVTTPPVVYTDNVTRGEDMADMILQLLPDVITTNEFYASHNGNTTFFDAVMDQLGEYYVCLDSPYDKDKPEAGADAIKGKTVNSNIIYRKDIGLEVVSSAWRYSTQKTSTSSANPMGYIYYHGSHTAVFSYKGSKFILSTAHYADSRSSNQWAREQLSAIADAKAAHGSSLPVILTGDLYTSYNQSSQGSGYKFLVASGYSDAQRTAAVNANRNTSQGTFHKIGERETGRISEDFIWYTDGFKALCFKVLANQVTDDASDHYPVMADISFD